MELRGPVEGEARVVLGRDVRRGLDPEPLHDVTLDVETEDRRAWRSASSRSFAILTPPALPATADFHLRLDHGWVPELVRRHDRLVDRVGDRPW